MLAALPPGWQGKGVRIIAGTAGRRAIRVPKGETRPSTDFVRQALFSILGPRVEEARCLDLFAGSGALGLEALSRGAASCVFVDESRAAERVLGENLAACRLAGGSVVRADVHRWLRRERGIYDLVFADPPYAKSLIDRDHLGEMFAAGTLPERVVPGGILVVEQPAEADARVPDGFELLEHRCYGGCAILLYAREGDS
ncbi:methyltransferase [Haloferula helveola]|uniref:Methyltransferase n=1 Tax=Haloferula helveola TaxID=490095 RepID=A0ABN6H800_9BACT|nr:methyltransferase [Haloferula helveola]